MSELNRLEIVVGKSLSDGAPCALWNLYWKNLHYGNVVFDTNDGDDVLFMRTVLDFHDNFDKILKQATE